MPEATKTYCPVPHWDYLQSVTKALEDFGYDIAEQHHALSKDGQRYFGMLFVPGPKGLPRDFEWAVGLRNSSDKSIACRLALGTRVFVCDNLAFSGEINVERKHTSRVFRDLPGLISSAVGDLRKSMLRDDQRRHLYAHKEISDVEAHDVLIRALRGKVLLQQQLPHVAEAWHAPAQPEFEPRNVWSLFNAFTCKAVAPTSAGPAIQRGKRLHALMDGLFTDVDFDKALATMPT